LADDALVILETGFGDALQRGEVDVNYAEAHVVAAGESVRGSRQLQFLAMPMTPP
jgi:hypothetical protein